MRTGSRGVCRVNRYYDPATAQFLTVDPLVSHTQSPYGYTQDDPVNLVDPTGLCIGPECWLEHFGASHSGAVCGLFNNTIVSDLSGGNCDKSTQDAAICAGNQVLGQVNPGNLKKVSASELERVDLDPHQLKTDILGRAAKISKFDVFKDSKTGDLFIGPHKPKAGSSFEATYLRIKNGVLESGPPISDPAPSPEPAPTPPPWEEGGGIEDA